MKVKLILILAIKEVFMEEKKLDLSIATILQILTVSLTGLTL